MIVVDPSAPDPAGDGGIRWACCLWIVLGGMIIQVAGEFIGRYGFASAKRDSWLPLGFVPSKRKNAKRQRPYEKQAPQWLEPVLLLAASALTGMVAGAAILAALYGARHFFPDVAQRATLGFPLVLSALAFSNVVRAGFSRRWTDEDVREWWGRASGIIGAIAIMWLALSLVVIQVPTWLLRWASTWSGWTAGIAGFGSIALAVATTVVGFWSKHGSDLKEKAKGFGQALGLRTMEAASGASLLVIATSASLLLGVVVANPPFRLETVWTPSHVPCTTTEDSKTTHATKSPVQSGGSDTSMVTDNAKNLERTQADKPCAADRLPQYSEHKMCPSWAGTDISVAKCSIEKRETCTVLASFASKKPDTFCGKARAVCAASGQPLPVVCIASASTKPVGPKTTGSHAGAYSAGKTPTPTNSAPTNSVPEHPAPKERSGDALANGGEASSEPVDVATDTMEQIMTDNFALGWLVLHELSLMGTWYWLLFLAFCLLATCCVASFLFGANAFSLNSFYGNRLTRAYLGASRPPSKQQPHPFTGFDKGDNLPLYDIAPRGSDGQARLLPIVNTALNLICPSGDRLEWQERKASSFFMTPYYCGSRELGFVPTKGYAGGLSVGRAMAISGAAASPSMGYHSSPLVTLLMAFFNVRLGWWMPNPKAPGGTSLAEPRYGIGPIISEMFSQVGDKNPFVYLSDGGHFENLGLYEMVRRRCRRILLVDAVCDPEYQYEDLEDAVRKIRIDFGISVTFEDGLLTPARARATGCHYCSGVIHYSQLDGNLLDGEIVYIKPVLSGDEPVDVRRYAESTRSDGRVFPQQSTEDQFFDGAQFESYRELGLHSVLKTFAVGKWPGRKDFKTELPSTASANDDASKETSLPKWAPSAPANPSGGVLAALTSLGPLGQAAMVASITAAVTVTGTVALKDATVTIKDPMLTLSSPTVTLDTHGAALKLEPGQSISVKLADLGDVAGFAKGVQRYIASTDPEDAEVRKKLASEINNLLASLKGSGTGDGLQVQDMKTAIEQTIIKLNGASKDLKNATGPLNRDFETTIGALKELVSALKTEATTLHDTLQKVVDKLTAIEARVKKISPRETVRGG